MGRPKKTQQTKEKGQNSEYFEHLPKKLPKKEPWYKKTLNADDFIIKHDKDNNFYARHTEWKNTTWIGPYGSKEELEKVLKSYINNTKKPYGERKEVKNLHSAILNESILT